MKGALPSAVICIAVAALAQVTPPAVLELNLVSGYETRLASPDGSGILYGMAHQSGVNEGPQLWFADVSGNRPQMLMSFGGALTAFWSPDGNAFSVNRRISDKGDAYVYDANTLGRLDLGERILAVDPDSAPLAEGHAYFEVERWETAQQVIVRFHGHTDEAPLQCFNSNYRVSRAGAVEKLSQIVFHSNPITNPCNQ